MQETLEAKQWTAGKSPESMVGVVVSYFAVLVLLHCLQAQRLLNNVRKPMQCRRMELANLERGLRSNNQPLLPPGWFLWATLPQLFVVCGYEIEVRVLGQQLHFKFLLGYQQCVHSNSSD